MKTILLISLLIITGLTAGSQPHHIPPPAPVLPVPTEAQLAWHEMEMNAFIHFSVNTFTDLEWGLGSEPESLFNPSGLDAMQWTRVLKEAGFRGVILTCKHHDGFCLWPSAYTKHSVAYSPYKNGQGDLVKEVSDACRMVGLKFGVYLSPWDRNHAEYGNQEYIHYYRNQLAELFTRYGSVFEMWFDGANGGTGYYGGKSEKRTIDGRTYYDWPNTLDFVRKLQPGVVFFSDAGPGVRWVGNEQGVAGETNWATLTPDTLYAGKPNIEKLLNEGSADGTHWIPSEVDVSIRPGWFYHQKEDALVKSPERLFEIYLTSVGRGSVLLLNVPPDKRGLIHENDIKALKGFRELLDREFATNLANGAKISATSSRGTSVFAPSNVNDDNRETYWATRDGEKSASLEIDMKTPHQVQYVVIQEYIKLGQRIKACSVEVFQGGDWIEVARITTVGYKRIIKFNPVQASKVRINILDAKACPVISNVALY